MKPLVYCAGPITGDPFGCVRQSMGAFFDLRCYGVVPILPQWSVIAEMVEPQPYETWLEYDFDLIRRCDGLLRLKGVSPGADREVAFAESIDVPVFRYAPDLIAWAAAYTKVHP